MIAYERDPTAWAAEQASMLRARRADSVDRAKIAAELRTLAEAEVETLRERIRIVLTALLRWAYQVDLRSVALEATISAQRHAIERRLRESPSLKATAANLVIDLYLDSKRAAVLESGLFDESFPEGLPFLPSEVFDSGFLPDPYGDDRIRGNGWWRRPASPPPRE
jgi:hypothetical protein